MDRHVYARENGWMIAAFCDLCAVSGDASALTQAQKAAQSIVLHRCLPGDGFRHDDADPAGPYLGDTLAMGQAFLELYNVTADRNYLSAAGRAADFIAAHFAPLAPGAGFITSSTRTDTAYPPHPDRDENIALVRFASKLAFAASDKRYRDLAAEAMRYLAANSIALRPLSAGILLAADDESKSPLHITILGAPQEARAAALHVAALRALASHELIEWRDPADRNPLPTNISYPNLNHPALFLCTATSCSSPTTEPERVPALVRRAQTLKQ